MNRKTETIAEVFEQDHREIDAIFSALDFASPAHALPRLEEFHRRLEAHIGWEEDLLFPAVARRLPALEEGPIRVMKLEHQEIRRHKATALQALRTGDASRGHSSAEAMRQVLAEHNVKEERVLYPACDELLSPQEAREILSEVRRRKDKPDSAA